MNAQLTEVIKAKEALAKEFDGDIARLEEYLMAEQERHKKAGRIRFESFVPTPLDLVKD